MKKISKIAVLGLLVFGSFFATLRANAGCPNCKVNVPTATCFANSALSQYPKYVCCELLDKHGHHVWRDTWVSGGSCKAANPYATFDMGCDITSPVYTTGQPILGKCQFSKSTGEYL